MRLLCFPYAGGSAVVYRDLQALLPDHEVRAIELPGRGMRIAEPAHSTMQAMIDALLRELDGYFREPFALFGHSMGASIAHELAWHLSSAGRANLRHLFVSGRSAPGHPYRSRPLHGLDDAAFTQALRDLGGTSEEILDNDELMELFRPMLRADFALVENHRPSLERVLAVGITAFAGSADDRATPALVADWQRMTRAAFDLHVCEGGHFFLRQAMPAMAAVIAARLAGPLPAGIQGV